MLQRRKTHIFTSGVYTSHIQCTSTIPTHTDSGVAGHTRSRWSLCVHMSGWSINNLLPGHHQWLCISQQVAYQYIYVVCVRIGILSL